MTLRSRRAGSFHDRTHRRGRSLDLPHEESEHVHAHIDASCLREGESGHGESTAAAATASSGEAPMCVHFASPLRRRQWYVVTFEHGAEPLRLKAAGLREVRAYLRAEYPDKPSP